MIIFPYQSLPRRSQMWLWNRWLGQPTKRDADKNSQTLTEPRAVQFVMMRRMRMMTIINDCSCWCCWALFLGCSGACWTKGATWSTWSASKSSQFMFFIRLQRICHHKIKDYQLFASFLLASFSTVEMICWFHVCVNFARVLLELMDRKGQRAARSVWLP